MKVIVIGAGLGGLTLAQGLRRAGIDVAVYERDGARGRTQGVSLHVDDRGTAALQGCLPSAHVAMIDATMGGPREQTLSLSEVDGSLAVVGVEPSVARPGRQAHRPLLRAILLTGLEVRFGTEFTRFEQLPDGLVRAWFADGSTDTADVLVGADGIGSAVRRQYLPQAQVIDTGRRMLMGATALRLTPELPDLIGDNPAVARIPDTTMVVAALRFTSPPTVARQRFLPALPHSAVALEDYLMWALPGPAGDLPRAFQRIVDKAWPEMTSELRTGTIPPIPAWPASPVTVLGDAIRLAPGFGGNLAMRDAHRLCLALAEADRGQLPLLDAIGSYEDTMRTSVPVPAKARR
ncbi:FAD-dependent oxidoreductase [Amycolatopsis dendrobii]|uniref:FAD-dependent monooxygenase n=1 Tax=Amycolatopsis dendrobii TaxID=2760662 RepID=A0A7W3Z8I3_9PSEU|nr:NAD(P)/FAD-dependent oxidoreductase [Amycolatopsis dendrobii]MBB1152426.1 FAD-dependent monooxygenase [Amycolatopsis dendrobii]